MLVFTNQSARNNNKKSKGKEMIIMKDIYLEDISEIKNAVSTLLDRFDNLYILEDETNVAIELLERLKFNTLSLDDVSITTVMSLFEAAIKYGCAENKENKFKYLNKVYYGELPLTFSVTTSYIVVLNDIAVLENEIPGISEEIKEHIKDYMVDHVNNAGFLIQKDRDIICCTDYDINLSCGTKCKATDNTYRFIRGLTKMSDSELLFNLFTSKIIVYDMLNDKILNAKSNNDYRLSYA